MTSRSLIALLATGLMAAASGAVLAAGDDGSNGQSAAKSEYKPGFGPCQSGGTNPSGTHTGPPGQPGQNCETRPDNGPNRARSAAACATGSSFLVRLSRNLRRATVRVDGRKVPVRRRSGRLTARYRMAGATPGPKVIRVKGVTRGGTRVRGRRVFDPCRSAADPFIRTKKVKKS